MDQKYKEKILNDFVKENGGFLEKYLLPASKNRSIYSKKIHEINLFKDKDNISHNSKYGVELLKVKKEPPLFVITDFNIPFTFPIFGHIESIASLLMLKYIVSEYVVFDGIYPAPHLITFLVAKPIISESGDVIKKFNCIELSFKAYDALIINGLLSYGFFKPDFHYLEEDYFKEIISEWQKD